jgi:23S rRNA (cytosine1962-C5)-methyltransferase
MTTVRLKSNRDRSLRHRHPWVFSGAIDSVDGSPEPGEIVDVADVRGGFLARGYYNEQSRIRVRALTWDATTIDDAFWRERVRRSVERRKEFAGSTRTNACRLVHAEADLLPGLIVDRYADVVVAQFLTAGIERARTVITETLAELPGVRCVFERSDTASRGREGLGASIGSLVGEAPGTIEILENGIRFVVSVETGQKTGFYLDQRDNRTAVREHAVGRAVLDAFCNTGAFGIGALTAGAASVTFLDSSANALESVRGNLDANQLGGAPHEILQADVFDALRVLRDGGRRFGLIVLDPPRFALNQHQLDKALRAYKDINMLAMELLEPEGILATFSCSQAVDIAAFTMAVSWAGVDAGRDVQIIHRLGQGVDHPVLAAFPESEYLKGLLCRIA